MKKTILFLLFIPFWLQGQDNQIIPKPLELSFQDGTLELNERLRIYFPDEQPEWESVAEFLAELITGSHGMNPRVLPASTPPPRHLDKRISFKVDSTLPPEGYRIGINFSGVAISASTSNGAFYAVQTLSQLTQTDLYSQNPGSRIIRLPYVQVLDHPRFKYRGLHLDVCRHFFSVEFVKRYIDLLAMHKMNRFHWHLTEDQGWRIEIKQYPRLQEIASCREETLVGHYSDQPHQFDGEKYCGYYTQEEIREVIEHAKSRHVTIVPEIEMPGHSNAALAAYPELGCTGGPYETATKWGVFEDVYCAGSEKTFAFLEGVLKEVCELFPGEYIHIGGDECPKSRWKECSRCQRRMKEEGLADEHALQSYFIKRIEKVLQKYDKKLIGWDEILEGGLAPNATVMSWRGTEGGIAAAKAGHDAIMCPGSHCYLDHYQGNPDSEPLAIGGYTTLQKSYSYEPVPDELTEEEAKHILGVQGNVWTEYITTPEKVEYMAYPRGIALAEVAWSSKEQRNWDDFSKRIEAYFSRLNQLKVNYSKCYYDVLAMVESRVLSLHTASPNVDIYYTLDGSEPGLKSSRFTVPVPLDKSVRIRAASFAGTKLLKNNLSLDYLVHKATGKPYIMTHEPSWYTGGEKHALTNGKTGSSKSWGDWVGLSGKDFEVIIDLESPTDVSFLNFQVLVNRNAWIYPPSHIGVFTSIDGENFQMEIDAPFNPEKLSKDGIFPYTHGFRNSRARFIKLVVKSYGKIPDGAQGAGYDAWLFIDEIKIQ